MFSSLTERGETPLASMVTVSDAQRGRGVGRGAINELREDEYVPTLSTEPHSTPPIVPDRE